MMNIRLSITHFRLEYQHKSVDKYTTKITFLGILKSKKNKNETKSS